MLAEDATWIKIGIMINVDVSAKIWENIRYVKKKLFGILVHVLVKRKYYWYSVVTCGEFIKVTKAVQKTFSTKTIPTKTTPTETISANFTEEFLLAFH